MFAQRFTNVPLSITTKAERAGQLQLVRKRRGAGPKKETGTVAESQTDSS